ncbi:NUMOD3 domain-containing DNA-binding protein [Mycobacterium sp.]|uniref:NUMOD3 domain-containing DNA-binding protein n=1 Tax=Mycobacterium sp. TaxID=1785 RepID=UPI00120434A7|nr:NUMOD3 domain-containing DNA-binding protein [Mycobacterium sp.]TAM64670.1 MAG: NUMOD3 motif protein [Mycobacterium sp.]
MTAELPTEGFIYGVRLRSEFDYRYVGLTTKSVEIRLKQHFKIARSGRKTPLYDWLRTHDLDDVIADELDSVKGIEELGQAEIDWIELLRRYGHPLLNLSQGGLGPMGVEWTAEMREAASIRSTGRKGVSRFAENNPFYGRSHSPERRAQWSKLRKGKNTRTENPNYGKFGEDHPSFGHSMSEEARQRLAEQRRGPGNPNYGQRASEETRAKMSGVRKGRPMPSSRRSAHTRHHTNRGVKKDTCQYCIEDSR